MASDKSVKGPILLLFCRCSPGHGDLGTMETIRGQRNYLGDMLQKVEAGIRDGKNAEQLSQEIDLTKYQPFGAEPRRTAGQVRTMYRALAAKTRK